MSLRNYIQKLLLYWLVEMPQVHGLGLVLSLDNAGHGLLRSRRTVKASWEA